MSPATCMYIIKQVCASVLCVTGFDESGYTQDSQDVTSSLVALTGVRSKFGDEIANYTCGHPSHVQ